MPFIIERQTENDLPRHIQGSAVWNEIHDEEGYFLFDPLSTSYRVVEYQDDNRQWYFIQQDTKTRNWVATQPVPSSLGLGRQSIKHSTTQAADVDEEETGHIQSPSQAHQHNHMATTTQTFAGTSTGCNGLCYVLGERSARLELDGYDSVVWHVALEACASSTL